MLKIGSVRFRDPRLRIASADAERDGSLKLGLPVIIRPVARTLGGTGVFDGARKLNDYRAKSRVWDSEQSPQPRGAD